MAAGLVMRLRGLLGRDAVAYEGLELPPAEMRAAGSHFQRDEDFVAGAEHDARKLVAEFGVSPDTRLLDVGCGAGRLAVGLVRVLGAPPDYLGLDVDAAKIRWCQRHLTRAHPRLRFAHVNVANARYNPGGEAVGAGFRLPVATEAIDVAHLYSVFSHMEARDVEAYAGELARVLAPGSAVFLTAFVEDDVPDVEVNPAGYRHEWSGELHCVRYARGYFTDLLARGGLEVRSFSHATERDGQSAVVAGPLR